LGGIRYKLCLLTVGMAATTAANVSAGGPAVLHGSVYHPRCLDFTIIDSRGSGENPDTVSGPAVELARSLEERLHPPLEVLPNPYPAVGIVPTLREILSFTSSSAGRIEEKLQTIRDALNGVGTLAGIARIGAYHDSLLVGETRLRQAILRVVADCGPRVKVLILVGYSQGAQVTGDVYQSLPAKLRQHLASVVLFGDPRYNHRSFADIYQRDNNGILPVRGEFPAGSRGKVLSYCHARDPICQGFGQFVLHGTAAHPGTTKRKSFNLTVLMPYF
jgi:hypothetical protein